MSKEIFCELLPPGIDNVKDLSNIPNKSLVFSQASNALKENLSVSEEGKFSQETRKKLTDGGYFICEVGNHSINQLLQGNSSMMIKLHTDFFIDKLTGTNLKSSSVLNGDSGGGIASIAVFKRELKRHYACSKYQSDQRYLYGRFDAKNDIFNAFSQHSELAFKPDDFFKKDREMRYGDFTLDRQISLDDFNSKVLKIIESEEEKLRNNISVEDVYLILGEAIDYVEAITQFVSSTGRFIKEKKKGDLVSDYFFTATYCGELSKISRGYPRLSFSDEYISIYAGFDVYKQSLLHLAHKSRYDSAGYIAPLIVPK